MKKINGVILQAFEWYLETNQNWWNTLSAKAEELADIGIIVMWFSQVYK